MVTNNDVQINSFVFIFDANAFNKSFTLYFKGKNILYRKRRLVPPTELLK